MEEKKKVKMGNILTDIPIKKWMSELKNLKIPEHDPYEWPGARSFSIEKKQAAYKAADAGLWRKYEARGWSVSFGTILADIVLVIDGRRVGIFEKGDGSVIKFDPPSKKSIAMMEKIIALVSKGIPAPFVELEWEKAFQWQYRYAASSSNDVADENFIKGIQRLIDTGRLWEDMWLSAQFKSIAYRLILAGKCHRKMIT